MNMETKKLAVVTGASTGIGLELAKICVTDGYDLIIASDEPQIEAVRERLGALGNHIMAVEADLSGKEGVQALLKAVGERPVDLLFANAGRGLGRGFFDQNLDEALHVVHTNIDGTVALVHAVGRAMIKRNVGRILITGSIAGLMPGTFQAVYNGTKAFLDSFSVALSEELRDSEVTVTCLMPGATETEFFRRADMLDTEVGTSSKDDPAAVARTGYDAMMKGELKVVAGFANKLRAAASHVAPDSTLAKLHRDMAEPGKAPPH